MTAPVADLTGRRPFIRLAAGALMAAAGCRPSADRAYARGNTLIVGVPQLDVDVLQPGPEGAQWLGFLPLAVWNEKGDWEGRLAERWEHSPDYREWTYSIRPDVRWHDGVPVTAHDVKFSLDLLAHPDVVEISPSSIDSVTVLNDHTVRVHHRRVADYAVDNVSYPKHLLERLNPGQFYQWDFWKRPVGNGPYRFVRYQPQTMIELEANPDYYRGKPPIGRVVLKLVGQAEAGLFDLQSGNVDALTWVNPAWLPSLSADPRFVVYYSDNPNNATIVWQQAHPLFRDPRVRRALTLAINRRELLQVLGFPKESPLTDGPVTLRQLRRRELVEPLPYDPDQARALFEAAGWHTRAADGVREREGLAFRFTALVNGNSHFQRMALFVQGDLRRVGVDMSVNTQQGYETSIKKGELREAAFLFMPNSPVFDRIGTDALGYTNATVVELVNRIQGTVDPVALDRLYGELLEIFRADVPVTYLVPGTITPVAHRRVQGLRSPFRTNLLQYVDELSLDDGRT